MTTQIEMKKQMKRKIELALKNLLDDLAVEYAIELESILTSDFSNSLDFRRFKEIITEKEKQIEKQTRLITELYKKMEK